MSRQSQANKKEKSLAENVLIVTLVACLMGTFIYYFFKQEQQLTQVGYNTLARNFSSKVTAIRAQWFMDNQPNVVIIKEGDAESRNISVNSKGWVDYLAERQNCQKVWLAVMENDLTFMNQPIVVVEIKHEQYRLKNICRYSLVSGESFDYQIESGKVTEVTKKR